MIQQHVCSTPCGDIRGVAAAAPGVTAFKGIRYAAAGRWEYPKQVTHWTRIKSRTKKIRTEIRIEIKIGKNNDK